MSSNSERIAWLNEQYSPSRTAHDFEGSIRSYRAGTEAARAALTGARHRVLAYGPRSAERIECFLPLPHGAAGESGRSGGRRGAPIFAFLHGGWWQDLSIDYAAAPAPAVVDAGALWASIGYTLAPNVSLREIVAEVSAAVATLAAHAVDLGGDPSRIVLAGHSAGAHLAAMQLTALAAEASRRSVAGLLLIGGAYDLAPIAESYVNEKVRMSAADAGVREIAAAADEIIIQLHEMINPEQRRAALNAAPDAKLDTFFVEADAALGEGELQVRELLEQTRGHDVRGGDRHQLRSEQHEVVDVLAGIKEQSSYSRVSYIFFGKTYRPQVKFYQLSHKLHFFILRQFQLSENFRHHSSTHNLMTMKGPAMSGFEFLGSRFCDVVQQCGPAQPKVFRNAGDVVQHLQGVIKIILMPMAVYIFRSC